VEVEIAERSRVQSSWVLTGALDWARLILREDARSGGADHLAEPWAVPLQEARLSTFLAANEGVATVETAGNDTQDAFLSGQIIDLQSQLNVMNLVEAGKVSEPALRAFSKLFELLGLPTPELNRLVENLRFAGDTSADNRSGPMAPLLPQRVEQLTWLGLSPYTVSRAAALRDAAARHHAGQPQHRQSRSDCRQRPRPGPGATRSAWWPSATSTTSAAPPMRAAAGR
jgi:general secretion pathway protein K